MFSKFIIWAIKRDCHPVPVVTFDGRSLFKRYHPFWRDEWLGKNKLPWWRPFNLFLHHWMNGESDAFHDHPRWSITICLRGQIIEKTPWSNRLLKRGSVVFRSRKFIHAFEIPKGHAGKTWTLFIVGRRKHVQNSYVINNRGRKGSGLSPSEAK